MTNVRFNLIGLLLVLLAILIWTFVTAEIPLRAGIEGRSRRYLIGPLVLCGIAAAIHRLLRERKNAWPLSALVAGVIVLAVLALSAG